MLLICCLSSSIAALIASVHGAKKHSVALKTISSITNWTLRAFQCILPFLLFLFLVVVCCSVPWTSSSRQNMEQTPLASMILGRTSPVHHAETVLVQLAELPALGVDDARSGWGNLVSERTNVLQMCCSMSASPPTRSSETDGGWWRVYPRSHRHDSEGCTRICRKL